MPASESFRNPSARCPRCTGPMPDHPGALSRATRDEGAEVLVCPRCGSREAMRDMHGWPRVPLTEWPVTIDELLREERALLEHERRSEIVIVEVTPEQAEEWLENGGDDAS